MSIEEIKVAVEELKLSREQVRYLANLDNNDKQVFLCGNWLGNQLHSFGLDYDDVYVTCFHAGIRMQYEDPYEVTLEVWNLYYNEFRKTLN